MLTDLWTVSILGRLTEHYITAQVHRNISVAMNSRYFTNKENIKIANDLNYLEILLTDWESRN
jgi:hypothetical protein